VTLRPDRVLISNEIPGAQSSRTSRNRNATWAICRSDQHVPLSSTRHRARPSFPRATVALACSSHHDQEAIPPAASCCLHAFIPATGSWLSNIEFDAKDTSLAVSETVAARFPSLRAASGAGQMDAEETLSTFSPHSILSLGWERLAIRSIRDPQGQKACRHHRDADTAKFVVESRQGSSLRACQRSDSRRAQVDQGEERHVHCWSLSG